MFNVNSLTERLDNVEAQMTELVNGVKELVEIMQRIEEQHTLDKVW